jgi:hypothetical protein
MSTRIRQTKPTRIRLRFSAKYGLIVEIADIDFGYHMRDMGATGRNGAGKTVQAFQESNCRGV